MCKNDMLEKYVYFVSFNMCIICYKNVSKIEGNDITHKTSIWWEKTIMKT